MRLDNIFIHPTVGKFTNKQGESTKAVPHYQNYEVENSQGSAAQPECNGWDSPNSSPSWSSFLVLHKNSNQFLYLISSTVTTVYNIKLPFNSHNLNIFLLSDTGCKQWLKQLEDELALISIWIFEKQKKKENRHWPLPPASEESSNVS